MTPFVAVAAPRRELPFPAAAATTAHATSETAERSATEAATTEATRASKASHAPEPAGEHPHAASPTTATHPATADAADRHQQQKGDHQDQPDRQSARSRAIVAQLAAVPLERHPLVRRDARGARQRAGDDPAPVIAVTKTRRHLLAEDPRLEPVGQHPFQAVAGLEADFALPDRDQHQEPVVLTLLTDSPALEHPHLVLGRGGRGGGLHDEHREIGTGLAAHLVEERLELRALGLLHDLGLVVHEPDRLGNGWPQGGI